MATWNKYNQFVEDLCTGKHDLTAAGNVVKMMLTNTAPNAATHVVKADVVEISAGNGYVAGGVDTQNGMTESGGVATVTAVDIVWTAAGGSIGPFRYAVAYNDTQASPVKPLIGWYDYGSSITVLDTETFTVDFGASWFTVT